MCLSELQECKHMPELKEQNCTLESKVMIMNQGQTSGKCAFNVHKQIMRGICYIRQMLEFKSITN